MPWLSIAKQAFSLILPATVLVIVPYLVEDSPGIAIDSVSILGWAFMVAGLCVLVFTIVLFVRKGRGTLAPWSPTRTLVVAGPYRYVRNPMITGVMTVLLGESLTFHSAPIFVWLILFFLINNVYFVVYEEPGLVKRFGEEYREYRRHVPRWMPRLTPWEPASSQETEGRDDRPLFGG